MKSIRRPPPKRGLAARPWLAIPLLLAVGLIVWAAWPQPRVEKPLKPVEALYRPDGGMREELAIRVLISESTARDPGCPCFEVQLGERSWLLEEPSDRLTIPETTAAWKLLARQYEDFTSEFAEAVLAVREREPDRRFGVITVDAPVAERWPAAVEIVQDAFLDADVPDSIIEPPADERESVTDAVR